MTALNEGSVPGYLFAGIAIALLGLMQALLALRPYRGGHPTDERPVVFVFSRVWLIAINAMAVVLLFGPHLFPDSPEERAESPWVVWLLPLLATLLILASEYLRKTQRMKVYGTHFAFPHRGRWHEVRFADVAAVEIMGVGLWIRLKNNECFSFATVFGKTPDLVSLLRSRVSEANHA